MAWDIDWNKSTAVIVGLLILGILILIADQNITGQTILKPTTAPAPVTACNYPIEDYRCINAKLQICTDQNHWKTIRENFDCTTFN